MQLRKSYDVEKMNLVGFKFICESFDAQKDATLFVFQPDENSNELKFHLWMRREVTDYGSICDGGSEYGDVFYVDVNEVRGHTLWNSALSNFKSKNSAKVSVWCLDLYNEIERFLENTEQKDWPQWAIQGYNSKDIFTTQGVIDKFYKNDNKDKNISIDSNAYIIIKNQLALQGLQQLKFSINDLLQVTSYNKISIPFDNLKDFNLPVRSQSLIQNHYNYFGSNRNSTDYIMQNVNDYFNFLKCVAHVGDMLIKSYNPQLTNDIFKLADPFIVFKKIKTNDYYDLYECLIPNVTIKHCHVFHKVYEPHYRNGYKNFECISLNEYHENPYWKKAIDSKISEFQFIGPSVLEVAKLIFSKYPHEQNFIAEQFFSIPDVINTFFKDVIMIPCGNTFRPKVLADNIADYFRTIRHSNNCSSSNSSEPPPQITIESVLTEKMTRALNNHLTQMGYGVYEYSGLRIAVKNDIYSKNLNVRNPLISYDTINQLNISNLTERLAPAFLKATNELLKWYNDERTSCRCSAIHSNPTIQTTANAGEESARAVMRR